MHTKLHIYDCIIIAAEVEMNSNFVKKRRYCCFISQYDNMIYLLKEDKLRIYDLRNHKLFLPYNLLQPEREGEKPDVEQM